MNYLKDFSPELNKADVNKNLYIAELLNEDETLTLLSDKVEDYDYNYIDKILNYPVVADTTLRSVIFEDNTYYLKATAKSDSEVKILLKLKINEKLADVLKSNLYSGFVMTANLSQVQKLPYSKNISDLDGNTLWFQEKNDILLEGELLKITLVDPAPHNLPIS